MAQLVYFSEPLQRLQQELAHPAHSVLREYLGNHPAAEFEIKLAEIATYCEVVLDGVYDSYDIDKLADIFVGKLQDKRGAIIVVQALHQGS